MANQPEKGIQLSLFPLFLEDQTEAAFEDLYKHYAPVAMRLALAILHNPQDAADVVGTVFLKLCSRRRRIRVNKSFDAYFYGIVKNAALDLIRKRKHSPVDLPSDVPIEDLFANKRALRSVSDPPPQDQFDQILALIADPGDRQILSFHYRLGLTIPEIAAELGMTQGQVKFKLSRALGELRTKWIRSSR